MIKLRLIDEFSNTLNFINLIIGENTVDFNHAKELFKVLH